MDKSHQSEKQNLDNPYVYLDFKFGDVKAGRIVIELFKDKVPKTAENFRALCTGEKGVGVHGKPLHYKGSRILKVIPFCMVMGGDIINNDGSSGESIYGTSFEDENFDIVHDSAGMVGMTNMGPNTNQSQFYITTMSCTHLDKSNVIVGKVVKGLPLIIDMANIPRENDKPLEVIEIEHCGEFSRDEPWNLEENDGTGDIYPPYPEDCNMETLENSQMDKVIDSIKNSGNYYYNKNNFTDSDRKYSKCLRYIEWYISNNKSKDKYLHDQWIHASTNLAAAKLKRQKYVEVIKICSEVLNNDPSNVKAFYRRAHARLALKDYEKAIDDLNIALNYCPNDGNIRAVLELTKKIKLSYLKREKKLFCKMFQ